MLPAILFCQNPLEAKSVDADFEEEFYAASSAGFITHLFDLDKFLREGEKALQKLPAADTESAAIYRGWMMKPAQYKILYTALLKKKYRLINTPREYTNCHYLPESLRFIHEYTPATMFTPYAGLADISRIIEAAKEFGPKPIVIKDYVKSEKHHWEKACYVPNAEDKEKLRQTIENFLALRGKELNEGIVLREFVQLYYLSSHSKSGMPLSEEYRLFFANGKFLNYYPYWDDADYTLYRYPFKFVEIAKRIESNFFTMDIARKPDGDFIIMELGDGQVSGIPGEGKEKEFYIKLKSIFSNEKNN